MHVNDFTQSGRREDIIHNCLKKFPIKLRNKIEHEIDLLLIDSGSYIKYDITLQGKSSHTLIVVNNVDDLSDTALTGLIAHLFALYSMGYDKQSAQKGERWLATDLHSDDIARDWGFKEEINDLRKIRPQKIPCEVKYPDVVIEHSAPSKEFDVDICSALNKYKKSSLNNVQTRVKVWYIDKFSMLCNLDNLREIGIEHLHIFTNKYTREDLNDLIKLCSAQ